MFIVMHFCTYIRDHHSVGYEMYYFHITCDTGTNYAIKLLPIGNWLKCINMIKLVVKGNHGGSINRIFTNLFKLCVTAQLVRAMPLRIGAM